MQPIQNAFSSLKRISEARYDCTLCDKVQEKRHCRHLVQFLSFVIICSLSIELLVGTLSQDHTSPHRKRINKTSMVRCTFNSIQFYDYWLCTDLIGFRFPSHLIVGRIKKYKKNSERTVLNIVSKMNYIEEKQFGMPEHRWLLLWFISFLVFNCRAHGSHGP